MLEIDKPGENDVLTITARNRLSKTDYPHSLPENGAIPEGRDALRFYIRLEDFSGFEAKRDSRNE